MESQQQDIFESLNFADLIGGVMTETEQGGTVLTVAMDFESFLLEPVSSPGVHNENSSSTDSESNTLRSPLMTGLGMADDSELTLTASEGGSMCGSDTHSSPQAKKGGMSQTLKTLFRKRFEKSDMSRTVLKAKVQNKELELEVPQASSVPVLIPRLQALTHRVCREVVATSYILHADPDLYKVESLNLRASRESQWLTRLKTKSELKNYMNLKLKAYWYLLELQTLHQQLMEVVSDETVTTLTEENDLRIKNVRMQELTASVSKPPMLRPTSGDFKPSRVSQEVFLALRDFVFNVIAPKTASRFVLAGALDQKEFTHLVSDPTRFMLDTMRYILMPIDEFLKLMFMTSTDGRPCTIQCPCGGTATTLTYGVQMHSESCGFKTFMLETFPNYLIDDVVSDSDYRVLSQKEKEYVFQVIKSRLPQEKWTDTVYGKQLELHQVGTYPKVLKTETDTYKQHRVQCAARSACYTCKSHRDKRT